jgi:hypothetical protein
MIDFDIRKTKKGFFRALFSFNTRLNLIILFGNLHKTRKECLLESESIRRQIVNNRNLNFSQTERGFRFVVLSPAGNAIAYSRFFFSKRLMNRVLSIVQSMMKLPKSDKNLNKLNHVNRREDFGTEK